MKRFLCVAATMYALVSGTAEAAVGIRMSFSGEITGGSGLPLAPGSLFFGSIRYDPSAMDLEPGDESKGLYQGAVTAYDLSLSGSTFNNNVAPLLDSRIEIVTDGLNTSVEFVLIPFEAPKVNGHPLVLFGVTLAGGVSGSGIDPNDLRNMPFRALLDFPGSLGSSGFHVTLSDAMGNLIQQEGKLRIVTPIPATLPLLAAGIAGIGWFGIRRRQTA